MNDEIVVRSVSEAKKVGCPVIYGIRHQVSKKIVYIGKSVSLHKRFGVHQYASKNFALSDWMKENPWEMVIVEKNPKDINEAEKRHIEILKGQLFNMVHGGEQNWRHHKRKPWMAGQNVKCPSDMLFFWLKNRRRKRADKLKEPLNYLKKRMTDENRAGYEIALAVEFYNFGGGYMKKQIEKWLSFLPEMMSMFEEKMAEMVNSQGQVSN